MIWGHRLWTWHEMGLSLKLMPESFLSMTQIVFCPEPKKRSARRETRTRLEPQVDDESDDADSG